MCSTGNARRCNETVHVQHISTASKKMKKQTFPMLDLMLPTSLDNIWLLPVVTSTLSAWSPACRLNGYYSQSSKSLGASWRRKYDPRSPRNLIPSITVCQNDNDSVFMSLICNCCLIMNDLYACIRLYTSKTLCIHDVNSLGKSMIWNGTSLDKSRQV